jgi:hypothetical protein
MKALFLKGITWAIISLMAVFITDILSPLGIAVDVLYICCILLVFRQNQRTILLFGLAASTLIVITLIVFDILSKINFTTLINHCISEIAIIITTYIAIHYQKVNVTNHIKEKKHVAELEDMLFITSHKVRRPVANILGLLDIGGSDILIMCPEEIAELFVHLKASTEQVDDFLKELNSYIEAAN